MCYVLLNGGPCIFNSKILNLYRTYYILPFIPYSGGWLAVP